MPEKNEKQLESVESVTSMNQSFDKWIHKLYSNMSICLTLI